MANIVIGANAQHQTTTGSGLAQPHGKSKAMRAKQDVITGTALFMFCVSMIVATLALFWYILKG